MNQAQTISVHYYHSNALLVVNTKGLIRILYTPFRVLCTIPINKLSSNTWVYVEEVYSTNRDELQYVIYGNIYSYKHFVIPIQF
ncbi:MAG: hypothetical protein IPJ81_03820 [Chitinophagaceae bacterium]|nr:hypothetical protein [Chitinophagaceae bacterium]